MNKRELLINTALSLFYKKGIHAVGINEVLALSGIAKKTLYNYFESKDALILACVEERDSRFMVWLSSCCTDKPSITEFIIALFDALDDWINCQVQSLGEFNGCFFVNAAAKYSEEGHLIHQQCLAHKRHVCLFIEQQLNLIKSSSNLSAHLSGKLNNDADVQHTTQITELLMLLKEGCINCAFVLGDKQSAQKAKAIALQFISGLSRIEAIK